MSVLKTLRRRLHVYGAFAAMIPKVFMAYSAWVWMQFIVQIIALVIFVYFWQAVYAGQTTLSGLTLSDTLHYIILAQVFAPVIYASGTVMYFGSLLRQGEMAIELLRPVDFQGMVYVRNLSQLLVTLILQIPLGLIAWFLFRFEVTADLRVWLAFAVTLLLGNAVMFLFDWILACASFYSTETWGLSVFRSGLAIFFSGSLLPLAMLPDWLQRIAVALPFAQTLYVPVSLLSGITPLSAMPRIWLLQGLYLLVLLFVSRLVFATAVRKVTVQGG